MGPWLFGGLLAMGMFDPMLPERSISLCGSDDRPRWRVHTL
jgi:hypothetical protein